MAKTSSKYDAQRSAFLKEVDQVNDEGPYRADWESLQTYRVPDWYKDTKFGIFIHGCLLRARLRQRMVSAADVHSELGRIQTPHCDLWTQDKFGYKDFIPMRKAEKLDPAAWASLFKDSGAKYVVPVFEHHDGFTLYDRGLSDWTAVKMGPHCDLVGDLAKAVRAQGLRLGASSHRIEHNFFLGNEGRSDQRT